MIFVHGWFAFQYAAVYKVHTILHRVPHRLSGASLSATIKLRAALRPMSILTLFQLLKNRILTLSERQYIAQKLCTPRKADVAAIVPKIGFNGSTEYMFRQKK